MAEDQTNKSAVTGGKREALVMTTTMTTTSYYHLLAEEVNISGGQEQKWHLISQLCYKNVL